jgi:hypothetical protein
MSILEKKAMAFEKLAALKNETEIDEILNHLQCLNSGSAVKLSVIEHAVAIMNERKTVLEKLAQ